MRFESLMAMNIKISVFWGVTLWRLFRVTFEIMMRVNMNRLDFGHGALQSGRKVNIGSTFLRNVNKFLPGNTALHPRI